MKKQLFLILASVLLCTIVYGQLSPPIHDFKSSKNHTDAKAVLYEQLAQPSLEGAIPSQRYPDYPTLDCQAADDFFVPEGLPWKIESLFFSGSYSNEPPGGPVEIANVFFYEDDNNSPGPELHAFFMVPVGLAPEGDLDVLLPSLVSLPQGHYWISIQPVMEYEEAGRWFWDKQTQPTYGEQFYWQNPGGGFGYPGTGSWTPGSEIEWSGTNNDLNLGFGIYGIGGGFPSVITHLSDTTPYAGQNIRIYGEGFGEFISGCFVDVNGIKYEDEITYWSDNEIFFNFPFLDGNTDVLLSAVTSNTIYSNSIEVSIHEPAVVYFLNLKENQILSDDGVFVSVAAEIDQDLISQAIFQYQPEGSSNWAPFGFDTDGKAQHYSTFYPIGSGDGWGKWWNYSSLADSQTVIIKAIMTTIFGQQLTGEISVIIDRTPLAPIFITDGSKLDGGLAYMNDSLVFEVEAKDDNIQSIELNWQPVFMPLPGWWEIERELDPINQMEVAFLDNEGDTVSHMACGPSAMASCLKWLSRQYPDSDIGKMTTDSLAKILAQDAGTDSTGTTSANLNQAVRNAVANDNGISDVFEVESTYNRSGNNSHNVSNDIAAGLRDSSDVVLLIYQKTENGDTLGHYVTASSFHSEYHYEWHGEIEAAIQTSWVDFMDPATGERTDKQIGFSSNPPTIEDYDLNPETSSGPAWVHSVTTIKPNNAKRNDNTLIASYPANGAGNYNLKLACADLPEGNNMIGIFGVNSMGDKAMNSYLRCVNGQYQLLPYFTSDSDTSITDYPINFIDLSMRPDTIVSWNWDFGDGHGVSTDQNPSHAYNETGEFDVRLVVSDGTIFDTITMPAYIKIVDAIEQNLELPAGWSGISSFVDPAWPNLDSLLVDVYDELVLMQNFSGILWPSEGINTLEEWNTQEGYKIKFETPVTINFRGFDAADRTIELAAGWNYLPVLSQCHTLSQEIQSQLGSKLTVIKEIAGSQVFWPEYGISSLGQVAPGTAYMMLLTEAATISFPECTKSTFENTTPLEVPVSPWGKIALSPNTHLVCILAEALENFKRGDIIGAFDGKGNCIGFSEIKGPGQNLALVVFGDDPSHLANQELIEGQNMQLKVFVANRNETVSLFPAYEQSMPDAGIFKTDGISVIKSLDFTAGLPPDVFSHNLSIFPNPSNGIVYLQGVREELEVSVFNNMGERSVQERVFGDGEIHLNRLPKGIYMLRVSNGEHTHFEKLVLQ